MSGENKVEISDNDTEGFRLSVNFQLRHRRDTNDPVSIALLELSDDWSAYCVSAMTNFAPLAGVQGSAFRHTIASELVSDLKKISVAWGESEDKSKFDFKFFIHEDDLGVASDLVNEASGLARAVVALQRSTLTALLAELDFFLRRFLLIIKDELPISFWDTKEQYSLEEIERAGGIDLLKQALLIKKIDDKLRSGHVEIFNWMAEDLGFVRQSDKIFSDQVFLDFAEICQARHLLIHNGGVVNTKYIKACLKAGWIESDLQYSEGDTLEIDARYIKKSIGRVYLTGLYFLHFCIQKRGVQEKTDSLRNLLNIAHDFVRQGHTKMCARICQFALFNRKDMDHDLTLRFGINYALSALHDPSVGGSEQVLNAKKILSKFDWSVRNPIFNLAYACARREFGDVIGLAQQASLAGLDRASVLSYAVFKEARVMSGFMDCFPKRPIALT